MERCDGQSDWCLKCNSSSVRVQKCGQTRVRYTDGDEEDFDLNSEADAKLLRSLVVDAALVPSSDYLIVHRFAVATMAITRFDVV